MHDEIELPLRIQIKRIVIVLFIAAPFLYLGVWAIMYYNHEKARAETNAYIELAKVKAAAFFHAYAK